jgi:hypothetical protein
MRRAPSPAQRGNILMVALIVVAVTSGFVAIALNVTNNTARMTDRSRDYAAAEVATEGAIEYAYGVWKKRIATANRAITTTEANASLTGPTFPSFAYAPASENGPLRFDALDEFGAPVATPLPVTIDLASYPGWRGRTFTYLARAKMMQSGANPSNLRSGVKRRFQYSEVPLFQAMFFFEHDIEIYRAAEMTVSGLVHTNSNAYLSGQSSADLTFQDQVSYVQSYSDHTDPPYANTWSGWAPNAWVDPIYSNGGESQQLHQVARMEPLGTEPAAVIDTTDANPNNDGMRELIETPNSSYADPTEFSQRRMSNKAGIVIDINGSGVTVTGQNGTSLDATQTAAIANAVSANVPVYDQREGKDMDVRTVDIAAVTATINGGIPSFNGVIYVKNSTPVTVTEPNPKAVRLKNGGQLPASGLTVASENPVYIQGDYNTGTTVDPNAVPANGNGNNNNDQSPTVPAYTRKPAAVLADAVTFLSNDWSDANASLSLSNRTASNTTYNVAIMGGFMPSGYQPATGSKYGYSGGANNFARFLEDWNNNYCTYFGSMVELYQSKVATGRWDTGVIYRPPLRRWNFDPNYSNAAPPGSPDAVTWSRGTWAKW